MSSSSEFFSQFGNHQVMTSRKHWKHHIVCSQAACQKREEANAPGSLHFLSNLKADVSNFDVIRLFALSTLKLTKSRNSVECSMESQSKSYMGHQPLQRLCKIITVNCQSWNIDNSKYSNDKYKLTT